MITLIIWTLMRGWGLKRLQKIVPILSDEKYDYMVESSFHLKRIYRLNLICKVSDHIWEVEHIEHGTDGKKSTYHVSCVRCFPHKHSRRQFATYNLFAYTKDSA